MRQLIERLERMDEKVELPSWVDDKFKKDLENSAWDVIRAISSDMPSGKMATSDLMDFYMSHGDDYTSRQSKEVFKKFKELDMNQRAALFKEKFPKGVRF